MGRGWSDSLQLPAHTGGLVFLSPSDGHTPTVVSTLERQGLAPVGADGTKLADWLTSPNEVLTVTRHVSGLLRSGKTTLLHLDPLVDCDVVRVPEDLWDFVCWRLGNVMLGLADQPSHVVTHGPEMMRGLIEALGDDEPPTVGVICEDVEVKELTERTMFPGLLVAEVPLTPEAAKLIDVVVYLESRRS